MFVIAMAGLSSRFFKAGYDVPKYQLMLAGETVFAHALKSFERYFTSDLFVIILRDVYESKAFVEAQMQALAIKNYVLVVLDKETEGQAETIYLALQQLPDKQDEPLYIFNIDTFRYDFVKPDFALACDGYIEVFQGEGEHWSFVEPTGDNDVARTTEKERISDLCSDGLYYFASNALFRHYFEQMKNRNLYVKNELYVAPMYNLLLADGKVVKYDLIAPDAIDFCGTPSEYEALLAHGLKRTTA